MRDVDNKAKETWRKADGDESLSDKVANAGDDVRDAVGNAGDEIRRDASHRQGPIGRSDPPTTLRSPRGPTARGGVFVAADRLSGRSGSPRPAARTTSPHQAQASQSTPPPSRRQRSQRWASVARQRGQSSQSSVDRRAAAPGRRGTSTSASRAASRSSRQPPVARPSRAAGR